MTQYMQEAGAMKQADTCPGIDTRAADYCAWKDEWDRLHAYPPAEGDAFDAGYRAAWKRAALAAALPPAAVQAGWFLPDSAINDLQQASIQKLWAHAKRARWTNAIVRKDAVEAIYEADWIKHMQRVDEGTLTAGKQGGAGLDAAARERLSGGHIARPDGVEGEENDHG